MLKLRKNKRDDRTDTPDTVRTDIPNRRTDKKNRRTDRKRTPDGRPVKLSGAMSGAPKWVGWFTDIGRPLSAMVVMVLCAPGERHLAELAGWGPTLSWGMAGLLVMYAGIAAVVATVRPKGAPGKVTATIGAVISLLLAMAAQPVSHYFVTGWMSASPRAPFWLVTVVSCVPPFVMGHLLHLAADPGQGAHGDAVEREDGPAPAVLPGDYLTADAAGWPTTRQDGTPLNGHPVSAGHDAPAMSWEDVAWRSERTFTPPVPDAEPDSFPWGDAMTSGPQADNGSTYPSALSAARRPVSAPVVDMRTYGDPDTAADADEELSGTELSATDAVPSPRTDGRRTDTGRTDVADIAVPDADTDMGTFIRDTWTLNPDMTRADMRTVVRRSFPDKKADAVRKAVARAEEAMKS